jgi:OFA family oxalate/formate antiporter-like MFS transporter
MFLISFSGLLVVSNLKPLLVSQGYSNELAIQMVSVFALGNMSGRIGWGLAADKLGNEKVFHLGALLLAASILILSFFHAKFILPGTILGLAFGFSFVFVMIPNKPRQEFGLLHFPELYPKIFLGYGLAGKAGPFSAGLLFDTYGNYQSSLLLAICLSLVSILVFRILVVNQSTSFAEEKNI